MILVIKEEADGRRTPLGGFAGYTTFEEAVTAIEAQEPDTSMVYTIVEKTASAQFTAPQLVVTEV